MVEDSVTWVRDNILIVTGLVAVCCIVWLLLPSLVEARSSSVDADLDCGDGGGDGGGD